jgi:hypothetical protein
LHTGFGTFTRRSASVWPLEEFHDEVIHTVLPADIEYRTNMRMTQAGESLSFAFETSPHGTIRNVFGQHLNGHGPIQACITRFIDLSHPARANRLRDFGLCIRPSVITSRLYHAIIS